MRLTISMAAGLLALAAVTAALGHAAPERFDPAPGAVLQAAPERVDGWFTQDVRRQEGASFIQVFDADAVQVDDGAPVIDDSDRRHAYVNLTPGLGEGRYMVAWQTLSDEDDELDGGCFWFFVGQAAADEAHQEGLRINAPEDCPVDIEEASAIFGQQEGHTHEETAVDATVTIDVPEVIEGGEVIVGLSTEGATIRVPTGEGQDPSFAHYHLYLDQVPVLEHTHEGGEEHMEDGEEMDMGAGDTAPDYSGDIMVVEDSYTFRGLEPGNHVLTAALFYDDHQPFPGPITDTVTFTIPGGDDGGVDTWVLIVVGIVVGVVALLIGGGLGSIMARRR